MLRHIRDDMRQSTLRDETTLVKSLVEATGLTASDRDAISARAADLVTQVRDHGSVGIMESFLAEYGLSTREGVALMCLAEAMLRVPDSTTVDELIKDKITPHDWSSHMGAAGSILVNASTWALMLTGRVLEDDAAGLAGTLHGLVRRMGEPVVRKAVGQAMAEMGSQFVLGESIEAAIKRGAGMVRKGYGYSYDMLGEAARTAQDAERYHRAYADAIAAISDAAKSDDIRDNPGISVKLSALHPRYEMGQREAMLPLMTERLLDLARAAKAAGIGLNIDAEEADRLDLSLDVIQQTLSDASLKGWDGFGVVVQAYGRRALPVLDWLHALSEQLDRRIMVRLVKGAYWDMEIKRAQMMGLRTFPVFTRKSHTDVSYLAGARKLLGMTDRIYPQFATHNAHSAAAVLHMAQGDVSGFEFQRLHGMGEALHDLVKQQSGARCRIYAPVGTHEDLLAYLVRRLLENGANGSFVHQIVDEQVPAAQIARDPVALSSDFGFTPSPSIQRPDALFSPRRNSRGWDLTDPVDLAAIEAGRAPFAAPHQWRAHPMTPGAGPAADGQDVLNPANLDDCVGTVATADATQVDKAVLSAQAAQPGWSALGGPRRASILRRAAELYEENAFEFLALTCREAGKTLLDGVAEIREAVDFLRYYADEAEKPNAAPARGVIACISPWNFPLAIFTGQIAAALAAGNAVVAKPAEQTPLIACRAVALMHAAGVPDDVLHCLPGDGAKVGAPLTAQEHLAGVCFTGSTEVAKIIDRQLAQTAPEAMFIAETGGLNAMIVDSTALLEQAVRDILRSAFQSAGQRCSALRMLYVQKDIADDLLTMLKGGMDALTLGDPWRLPNDVGPVIDADAHAQITDYVATQSAAGRVLHQLETPDQGLFVAPTIVQLDGIQDLNREIFGPVLHVARFEAGRLDDVIRDINAKGYGLTFGLHTRIDRRVQRVLELSDVGNAYVNRDQIGAVVGSQPFGGHGLSGTGPKAGGPNYLPRFTRPAAEPSPEVEPGAHVTADALMDALRTLPATSWTATPGRVDILRDALRGQAAEAMSAAAALDFGPVDLPGPTGESNQFSLKARGTVLCLGPDPRSLLDQAAQALAAGNAVLAVAPGAVQSLRALRKQGRLPLAVVNGDCPAEALRDLPIDAVAYAGPQETRIAFRRALADRDGPILPLVTTRIDPIAYCAERSVCVDTTAAGGNAMLLAEAGD